MARAGGVPPGSEKASTRACVCAWIAYLGVGVGNLPLLPLVLPLLPLLPLVLPLLPLVLPLLSLVLPLLPPALLLLPLVLNYHPAETL